MMLPITSHCKIRKGRRPSSVLSCLLKRHHPGVIDYEGKKVLATTWEHYQAVKDNLDHSVANKIEDAFWLRYNYEDNFEEKAKQHVGRCCKQLLTSIFYYARIQGIIDHFRSTENTNVLDTGKYYLTKDEYLAQRQTWCSNAAWAALCDQWVSPGWIKNSKKGRANRIDSGFKTHTGGSNSMTTISQKMSEEKGEEVSQIEAWVHTHRGVDENNPQILNTAKATTCLEPSSIIGRKKWQRACEKSQKAEAYASNVLSWGLGMYNHCNGIHKFLETLATNQEVPINEIPPPPVPPPARSPSLCQSPHQSLVHILYTSQDHPALCAQDHANQSIRLP